MTPITGIVFLAGVLCLIGGGEWLVRGASRLAATLGLSPLIIGLTVVAMGTSAPELATNVQATLSGQADIALCNVVGSNLFNLLGALGISALIAPGGFLVSEAARGFDLPVMVIVAAATLPILYTGYMISRWEGWLFIAYYLAYTAYLLLDAAQHDALHLFNWMMLFFAAPLTLITITALFLREPRIRRLLRRKQD